VIHPYGILIKSIKGAVYPRKLLSLTVNPRCDPEFSPGFRFVVIKEKAPRLGYMLTTIFRSDGDSVGRYFALWLYHSACWKTSRICWPVGLLNPSGVGDWMDGTCACIGGARRWCICSQSYAAI